MSEQRPGFEYRRYLHHASQNAATSTSWASVGRRGGKRAAMEDAVAEALEAGEHVHIAEPGKTTCVNGTCDTTNGA